MSRWNRSETSLKSSAYNHNGQNYFEQLTTYNSMSSHLRRVLLAKCVIDSKNENCRGRRKQFCKQIECKPHFTRRKITDNLIDRLAYDTLRHPADVLQMHYNSRYYSCHDEEQRDFPDGYDHNSIYPRSSLLPDHVIYSRSPLFKSHMRQYETIQNDSNDNDIDERSTPIISKDQDASQCRYTEDSIFYEKISNVRTMRNNRASLKCDENFKATREADNLAEKQENSTAWEEAKYVNFAYKITREILHNHFYTDDELREVFKRHVERNKELLNVNRMMFEIYQLKVALNVMDNFDEVDRNAQPRMPTPSKILNDNNVLEKVMILEAERNDTRHHSEISKKLELLVDSNSELVLTERDVLASLIESDIDPDNAQKIYRRLFTKSKESIPGFSNWVCKRLEQPSRNDVDSVDSLLDHTLKEFNDLEEANEHEKGSITQDLITQEDKDVQCQ